MSKRTSRSMVQAVAAVVVLAASLGVVGCDDYGLGSGFGSEFGGGGFASDLGYDDGSYFYGWTETDAGGGTHSFSLSPGIDAGDSLETYLGSFVSYP